MVLKKITSEGVLLYIAMYMFSKNNPHEDKEILVRKNVMGKCVLI